jgi:hypothetical protein
MPRDWMAQSKKVWFKEASLGVRPNFKAQYLRNKDVGVKIMAKTYF